MPDRTTNPYPPEGAFVLQFASKSERFMGRVEHVVSGQAARFESREDLMSFIRRVFAGDSGAPKPSNSSFREPLS